MNVTRNNRSRKGRVISEINITPLVDVMLVLLIIFMVTAPMLVSGVNVELPETQDSKPVASKEEPLVITIDASGNIFLFETKIDAQNLIQKLESVSKENKNINIFIRGDKNTKYQYIANAISKIYEAGFRKVALISNIVTDKQDAK
ncbi:MAG: ExbD/TolR family protein [Rickettsiaceae bacterium]